VTRGGRVVGIISRAKLMHALASMARDVGPPASGDSAIRDSIMATIAKQNWAPRVNVIVKDGVAELYGVVTDDRERQGLFVAAETVPGVSPRLGGTNYGNGVRVALSGSRSDRKQSLRRVS